MISRICKRLGRGFQIHFIAFGFHVQMELAFEVENSSPF